jgi:hypothetical protein
MGQGLSCRAALVPGQNHARTMCCPAEVIHIVPWGRIARAERARRLTQSVSVRWLYIGRFLFSDASANE